MRIAIFSDTLPPRQDGVVNTICKLVETLKKESFDFRFFSCFQPGRQYEWADRVHKVYSLPCILYSDYRMGIPYFQGIFRILDDFKPDIVHAVGQSLLSLYCSKYARRRKVRCVASYHTNFISYFPYYRFSRRLKPLAFYLQKDFFNRFDRILVPSAIARDELGRTGIRNIDIWPRGVDMEKFSPDNRSPDLRKFFQADKRLILLFVGRLVKEKNLNILVSALDLIKSKGYAFQMIFVGSGPMLEELQRRLPEAHFAGFLSGRGLSQWYASADLLVFPSTTETFGNVVLEAMASGTPAIVPGEGGVKELVKEGINGFIVKPHSSVDLANTIEFALLNREMLARMGWEAKKQAEKRSWAEANQALLNCYKQLLSIESDD